MTLLRRIRDIWVRVGVTLLVAMPVAMFLTFRPWGVGSAILSSSAAVAVTDDETAIAFVPATRRGRGLLLLPGCPVDPRAYAPLARNLAEEGFLAAIVKIPYRCATLPGGVAELDERLDALRARWLGSSLVLGGHSRGAVHAVRIAARAPTRFEAYVLMGTSHPRDHDLSSLVIDVTKIAATRDGVAGPAQFDAHLLPRGTTWVRIDGGNHSQFGYYGFQLFDGRAAISREEQQRQILAALVALLNRSDASDVNR
jgi:hypothetical protein